MRLSLIQKKNISQFFLNIATAWYVGAFVTPFLLPEARSDYFITVVLFATMNVVGFLYFSWRIFK